jgi:hypothetical protein
MDVPKTVLTNSCSVCQLQHIMALTGFRDMVLIIQTLVLRVRETLRTAIQQCE